MKVIGIMASTPEGVIGRENGLPWHEPEEMEHFTQTTQGHVIVMGRKTFESMKLELYQDRIPIVFSRNPDFSPPSGPTVVRRLEDFLSLSQSQPFCHQKIFMIGGAEVAHLFLEAGLIKNFLLTIIHKSYSGDVWLNLQFFNGWSKKIFYTHPRYTIWSLTSVL